MSLKTKKSAFEMLKGVNIYLFTRIYKFHNTI